MFIFLTSIFGHLLPKSVRAITLWPFIVFKYKVDKTNEVLINHEKIHLRQQIELLIIPFYVIYLIEYFILLIKFQNHQKAYRAISFEKEAYQNDDNLQYLSNRRFWSMWRSNKNLIQKNKKF